MSSIVGSFFGMRQSALAPLFEEMPRSVGGQLRAEKDSLIVKLELSTQDVQ